MKHDLVNLRLLYSRSRIFLGFVNRQGFSTMTKSLCMSNLNRNRHALKAEIKRVSWLVWPKTGRPHL